MWEMYAVSIIVNTIFLFQWNFCFVWFLFSAILIMGWQWGQGPWKCFPYIEVSDILCYKLIPIIAVDFVCLPAAGYAVDTETRCCL